MMNKSFASILVLSALLATVSVAAGAAPLPGTLFPDITLPTPADASEQQYLGVGGKEFRITDAKADAVIIEVFSIYCPYCQKEAPEVNKLYELMKSSPDTGERIKMMGIGAGNTAFEVNLFRKEYSIRFPLFSDESFSIHKALGEVRTPCFIVVKTSGKDKGKVIYSKVGKIGETRQFLETVKEKAGMVQ